MNKLLLIFLFLSCLVIVFTHPHHHHHHHKKRGGVKKIVKVITVGSGKPGFLGKRPQKHSSSSSSSSSSEEILADPVTERTTKAAPPTTTAPPKCDDGWLSFKRPTGLWCVLVGNKGGGNHQFSQSEAENICKQHSATLTGLQNDEERMEVANEALHQLGEIKIENGAVWLGATTTPSCKQKNCGPHDTFRWTDGHTIGTAGFHFGKDEPDEENYEGIHACLQQIVMTKTFKQQTHEEWLDAFKHGDLDKYQCENPTKPHTRLYACGRKAR